MALNGPANSLPLSVAKTGRWTVVETEPLQPEDLTDAEREALAAAGRLLLSILDNDAE